MLIKLITFRWRKLKAHHKNPTLLVEGSLLNYKKMPAYKPSIPVFVDKPQTFATARLIILCAIDCILKIIS